jgi:tRNA-(ms[2]io[6]A)-hydroxylase
MHPSENTTLGLKLPTDPRWVNLAEITLQEILSDHAYCEQKAASNCISLIQLYPDKHELVTQLAPVVTEEWGHFRMVLTELHKRGLPLGKQRKDEYVNTLQAHARKGGLPNDQFLDKLLMFALIEARSCERFRLLSENLLDEYLKKFYRQFMVAEAGHYRLFLDLAKLYFPEHVVMQRWRDWLHLEKEIIAQLPLRGDRMH